jgi:type IV pilus assembly protein PilY1
MIKDEDGMSNLQTTVTENELEDLTANLIQTGTQAQADLQKANLATSKGWMIRLADVNLGSSVPNPRPGEKAVGGVTTLAGSTIFATNTPAVSTPGSCTGSLGLALIYAVSIADGTSTIDFNGDGVLNSEDLAVKKEGGGFAPSPVPVLAQVPIYETGGSTGNDPNKPTGETGVGQCALLGPKTICPKGQQPDHRFRTFWNLLIDN